MTLRSSSLSCALAALVTTLSLTDVARADPTPQDRATAQTFFDRALALSKEGKWAEACPMLEESQRLDRALGTQFQLARCYEAEGRVASAWIQYVDLADAAKAAGQPDKEKAARTHADAVAPRVPKLQVDVAATSVAVEVRRDGATLPKIQWGAPLPVDPGPHTITASAPGRRTFETTIDVKEGASGRVAVPELRLEAAAATTTASAGITEPPPPATTDGAPTRRTAALVLGGVGVLGLGVGAALGLAAKSKQDGIGADCAGDRCNAAGVDARKSALGTATVGTVVGGVGVLALATGAVLWLTAPSSPQSAYLAPSFGGVSLGGRF